MNAEDDPDTDDRALFRAHVGDVTPLAHERAELTRRRPAPLPVHRWAEHRRVVRESLHGDCDPSEIETGEELLFARPGVRHSVLRRLRRGQLTVQRELDLHGLGVEAARAAVGGFLRTALADGLRCVRIVHGKGLGSPARRPVLKGKLAVWLRRRDEVLAYCSARPVDGGTGAVYVLLRRSAAHG